MNTPASPSTLHFFVDEAGDPTLFDAKGRILVGQDGCSETFIVGKLGVEDSAALHAALEQLRAALPADPYFKRVPSMQAERGKTARVFHAKDDVPEVRREVFKLLAGFGDLQQEAPPDRGPGGAGMRGGRYRTRWPKPATHTA